MMDYNKCNILYDPDHITSLLSNYKKRKVKDKRNKEIKVIMAKMAYNINKVLDQLQFIIYTSIVFVLI